MYEICSACSTQWQSKNTVKISSFMSNYHLISLKLTQYIEKQISVMKLNKTLKNIRINPIWTGFFAYLKDPRPNLAISSQMTMKVGRGILWVEIFSN